MPCSSESAYERSSCLFSLKPQKISVCQVVLVLVPWESEGTLLGSSGWSCSSLPRISTETFRKHLLLFFSSPCVPKESLLWGEISLSALSGGGWRLGKNIGNFMMLLGNAVHLGGRGIGEMNCESVCATCVTSAGCGADALPLRLCIAPRVRKRTRSRAPAPTGTVRRAGL